MNRSQVVGFGFIAAVAVVIAIWLAVSDPPPEPSAPVLTPRAMVAPLTAEQRATQQAQRLAASAASSKRETRAAQATELKQRLELVARALDDAKKNPPAANLAAPDATTTTTTTAPSGTLTKDQVKEGVAAVKPQIVDCYEQALAQNPKLAGKINVLFEIGEDPDDASKGAVVAGEVDSEMGSPFFEACVLQSIVGARFPRPDGGVVKVTYPFAFESHDEDAGTAAP